MSGLARSVGVHTSTISAMIWGRRETDSDTVNLVAEKLRISPVTVFEWVGRARTESEPFKPHPDADLLDKESRAAVNELIRLLARNQKAGGDRSGDSAATKSVPDISFGPWLYLVESVQNATDSVAELTPDQRDIVFKFRDQLDIADSGGVQDIAAREERKRD